MTRLPSIERIGIPVNGSLGRSLLSFAFHSLQERVGQWAEIFRFVVARVDWQVKNLLSKCLQNIIIFYSAFSLLRLDDFSNIRTSANTTKFNGRLQVQAFTTPLIKSPGSAQAFWKVHKTIFCSKRFR